MEHVLLITVEDYMCKSRHLGQYLRHLAVGGSQRSRGRLTWHFFEPAHDRSN